MCSHLGSACNLSFLILIFLFCLNFSNILSFVCLCFLLFLTFNALKIYSNLNIRKKRKREKKSSKHEPKKEMNLFSR